MTIEAPLSKYKKTNLKIFIVVLIGLAIWFAYDGYFNKKFEEKHNDSEGNPDSTMVFNRNSPPFFVGGAVLLGVYLLVIKDRKVIADEKNITVGKRVFAYDSVQKIDKTHFDSKGYFIVTYKDDAGGRKQLKLSNRTYDNLNAVLDELVAKIT